MHIDHDGTLPTSTPPEAGFVGDVRISGYFQREAPSRLAGATVSFAPGARTPWKVNPSGQTIVVTQGVGWAQSEGGEVAEIHAGDVVWFAPGERHWEGATGDQAMTYVAMQEAGAGGTVLFGGAVTDEQYQSGSAGD